MIVEFIGTPGAGKTTLMPTVSGAFRENGLKAYSVVEAARPYARRTIPGAVVDHFLPGPWRRPLLWQVFYHLSALHRINFFARRPRLLRQVLSYQRARPEEADIRGGRVLYWFFRQAGYYDFLKAHARPDEVLIFDEGFVHRVVQLFASGVEDPDPESIRAYVAMLPVPDLVISVWAPRAVCERRIHSRGLWERFRSKQPEEVSRFITNAHRIVGITISTIKQNGWPVLEVDNSGDDPSVAMAQLHHELNRFQVPASASLKLETA